MESLFENEIVILEADRAKLYVRLRRTSAPLPPLEELTAGMDRLRLALLKVDRAHYGLLVDSRDAPMRGDDSFGPVLAKMQELVRTFPRAALLVKTAVGKLQVSRTAREAGGDVRTFMDESQISPTWPGASTAPWTSRISTSITTVGVWPVDVG